MFNSNLKIFSLHRFFFKDLEYFSIRVIFKIWNSLNKEEKCDIYIYIFLSTKRKYIFCLRYSIRSISKNFDTQGIIINVASTTGENHPQKSSPRGFNHTLRPIILELIERTKYICTHVKYTTFKHSRDTLDGRKI